MIVFMLVLHKLSPSADDASSGNLSMHVHFMPGEAKRDIQMVDILSREMCDDTED